MHFSPGPGEVVYAFESWPWRSGVCILVLALEKWCMHFSPGPGEVVYVF